jgi:hypothetical protein
MFQHSPCPELPSSAFPVHRLRSPRAQWRGATSSAAKKQGILRSRSIRLHCAVSKLGSGCLMSRRAFGLAAGADAGGCPGESEEHAAQYQNQMQKERKTRRRSHTLIDRCVGRCSAEEETKGKWKVRRCRCVDATASGAARSSLRLQRARQARVLVGVRLQRGHRSPR